MSEIFLAGRCELMSVVSSVAKAKLRWPRRGDLIFGTAPGVTARSVTATWRGDDAQSTAEIMLALKADEEINRVGRSSCAVRPPQSSSSPFFFSDRHHRRATRRARRRRRPPITVAWPPTQSPHSPPRRERSARLRSPLILPQEWSPSSVNKRSAYPQNY